MAKEMPTICPPNTEYTNPERVRDCSQTQVIIETANGYEWSTVVKRGPVTRQEAALAICGCGFSLTIEDAQKFLGNFAKSRGLIDQ
jgi:hypothetical protein